MYILRYPSVHAITEISIMPPEWVYMYVYFSVYRLHMFQCNGDFKSNIYNVFIRPFHIQTASGKRFFQSLRLPFTSVWTGGNGGFKLF